MNYAQLAPLAVGVLLGTWAMALRIIEGSWFAPGAFFALWWTFAAIFPLFAAPSEPVSPLAMGWVLLASIAVGLGSIAGAGRAHRPVEPAALQRFQRRWFWLMAALITALGLASNVAFITGNGASLTDLFSLDGLVEFATAASSERYSNLAPPALSQALLPFVFLAPMVGGLLFGEVKSRVRLLALFTVVPGLVITVTQTAKAGSLIAGLLFISGYCTSQVRRNRLQMFTWHRCLIVLIAALPFTGFMYFVTFSRGGILDPALFQVASDKLRSALVGHMAVFSDWLTAYPQNTPDPTLGAYTFAGPAEALGLSTRIGGLFETTYFLNFGQSSNIYTAFRPLIQDFTVTGAVALLLAMGLAGGIGYRQVGSGRWWAATQLLLFYAITIWSPITWLLTYNSQIAAVIGLLGVLLTVPGLPGRWPPTLLRPGPRPDMRGIPEPTR